jgi:hypothetical protein
MYVNAVLAADHALRSACGIATVLVPLYLSSVAPPAIAGSIGVYSFSPCTNDVN